MSVTLPPQILDLCQRKKKAFLVSHSSLIAQLLTDLPFLSAQGEAHIGFPHSLFFWRSTCGSKLHPAAWHLLGAPHWQIENLRSARTWPGVISPLVLGMKPVTSILLSTCCFLNVTPAYSSLSFALKCCLLSFLQRCGPAADVAAAAAAVAVLLRCRGRPWIMFVLEL